MDRIQDPIIRSKGSNYTEEVLAKICDKTFLKLWVYPNPYKKVRDELCDVLVVFENHIFIFSVKDISFNNDKDINISWSRWKRKAIDESIKQIQRAENWIRSHPDKIFLDARCQQRFPIIINKDEIQFHRIIVAHGAEKACAEFSEDNVAGSLAISYSDKDNGDKSNPLFNFPFIVQLPRDVVFHVFDSFNLDIVLGELDTIRDFLWYVEEKERAVRKYKLICYCGEEDLLAHYLINFDKNKKCHFIGTRKRNIDFIHIGEGEWHHFSRTDLYLRKKTADKISYFWDHLLQKTLQNALDGTLLGDNDIYNGQSALKEMAKEPRFMRRELSKAIKSSIERIPDFGSKMGRNLSSYPSYYPDRRYVFLQVTPIPDMDYDTRYRPFRQEMLEIACGIEKIKRPKSSKVIGIGIDAPKYSSKNSEDFVLLDCNQWSQEQEDYYTEKNKELSFFETEALQVKLERTYEFPPPKRSTEKAQSVKIGRNNQCPCGSGRKYKKCCLNK